MGQKFKVVDWAKALETDPDWEELPCDEGLRLFRNKKPDEGIKVIDFNADGSVTLKPLIV